MGVRTGGCDARLIVTSAPTPSPAAARWAAATLILVFAGSVFLIGWVVSGRVQPPSGGEPLPWLTTLITIIAYGVAGALLIDRRPDLPFGWLLGGTAVLTVVLVALLLPGYQAIVTGHDGPLPRLALHAEALAFLPVAVQGLINVRFPSGRPASRKGRALEIVLIAGTVLVMVGGVFAAAGPVVVLLGLVAGLGVVVRFVRAYGRERQQLKWRAVGVLGALALFPLAVTGHWGFLDFVDPVFFVLTLVVPVLRYRLWAIDTILRRSLVYGASVVLLAAAYVGVSTLVAVIAPYRVAAPVAAVVAALSFEPVRRWVQRLFYGHRGDPYRTLRDLGRRINAVRPPQGMLASLVETAAVSLRLPYVAVERADGEELAAYGTANARSQRWPLVYEGRPEGSLVAAPRRGEDGFDERDRKLLADVAGQIGAAVHTEALTAELLASRQRLVTAREEERRRLRRDLHDGLGPVLTAVGLHLDAVKARRAAVATPVPAEADAPVDRHVGEAREATAQAIGELRRLVHGLRPPALDELGLLGALRLQADRLRAGTGLDITITAGDLPGLPAAVEVAAYRIAVEAMTNTVRHSAARHCRVRMSAGDGQLDLQIHDDGGGPGPWSPGVGLTAMRERAEELGGTLRIGPDATVAARIPVTVTG